MKFNLTYVDKDGERKTPVVLHRAVFGSIDRTIAYYLEETKGNLPLWLAPVQVNVIPVNNEYHLEYAKEFSDKLTDLGYRVNLDDRNEKLSYKMRESQIKKIPLTLILGDREKESKTISYRKYSSQDTTTVSQEEFLEYLEKRINDME